MSAAPAPLPPLSLADWAAIEHEYVVEAVDFPVLGGERLQPVLSTYALAREFERAGRGVFLQGRPAGWDALGTRVEVEHRRPARMGDRLTITATPTEYRADRGVLICTCEARLTGSGVTVAKGMTGQRLMDPTALAALISPPRPVEG